MMGCEWASQLRTCSFVLRSQTEMQPSVRDAKSFCRSKCVAMQSTANPLPEMRSSSCSMISTASSTAKLIFSLQVRATVEMPRPIASRQAEASSRRGDAPESVKGDRMILTNPLFSREIVKVWFFGTATQSAGDSVIGSDVIIATPA